MSLLIWNGCEVSPQLGTVLFSKAPGSLNLREGVTFSTMLMPIVRTCTSSIDAAGYPRGRVVPDPVCQWRDEGEDVGQLGSQKCRGTSHVEGCHSHQFIDPLLTVVSDQTSTTVSITDVSRVRREGAQVESMESHSRTLLKSHVFPLNLLENIGAVRLATQFY